MTNAGSCCERQPKKRSFLSEVGFAHTPFELPLGVELPLVVHQNARILRRENLTGLPEMMLRKSTEKRVPALCPR